MTYKGHVEKGAIVLDEPADLKDGDKVVVQVVGSAPSDSGQTPLRGTPYQYIDPCSPAVAEEDWDAAQ